MGTHTFLSQEAAKKKEKEELGSIHLSAPYETGRYHNLLLEMRLCDPKNHFRYLNMSGERFDALLAKVLK